jgi:hypothetical protein
LGESRISPKKRPVLNVFSELSAFADNWADRSLMSLPVKRSYAQCSCNFMEHQ